MSTIRFASAFPRAFPLRQGLITAACLVLAACGGSQNGGTGSSGSGGGGGSSGGGSIPGTTVTTPYFLSGPAGTESGSTPFISSLDVVNPALVSSTSISGAVTRLVASNWSPMATVGQWATSSGNASNVGIRYRVYADISSTGNTLQLVDLSLPSGSAVAPSPTQLSSVSTTTLCGGAAGVAPTAPAVINDYANPANSLLVFRDASCQGNATDTFTTLPLSASGSTAPFSTASSVEVVDAVRSGTGAITQFLVVIHGNGSNGNAQVAVLNNTLPVSAPALASATPLATLANTGNSSSGGDFNSLGVVTQANGDAVWLWRDGGYVGAARVSAAGALVGTAAPLLYSVADSDIISVPMYPDGTNAYVAATDVSNPTNRIVKIDTTTVGTSATPTATEVLAENTTSGQNIVLLGVAGSNLVYLTRQSSVSGVLYPALKVTPKNPTSAASAGTAVYTAATSTESVELDGASVPVLVGSSVFFTTMDTAASGAHPTLAYLYSGTSATLSAISSATGSQVIGGAVASPMPAPLTPNAPAYGTAIVVTFASSSAATPGATPSGGLSYAGATLVSFDASANTAKLGTLPSPSGSLMQTVDVSEGILQAGLPALLWVSGTASSTGYTTDDLMYFVPGNAGSLTRLTTNLQ